MRLSFMDWMLTKVARGFDGGLTNKEDAFPQQSSFIQRKNEWAESIKEGGKGQSRVMSRQRLPWWS